MISDLSANAKKGTHTGFGEEDEDGSLIESLKILVCWRLVASGTRVDLQIKHLQITQSSSGVEMSPGSPIATVTKKKVGGARKELDQYLW